MNIDWDKVGNFAKKTIDYANSEMERKYKDLLRRMPDEKVLEAYDKALENGNYKSIELVENEMRRRRL